MNQATLIKGKRAVTIIPRTGRMTFPVSLTEGNQTQRIQREPGPDHVVVFIPYTELEMRNRRNSAIGHVQVVRRDNLKSA